VSGDRDRLAEVLADSAARVDNLAGIHAAALLGDPNWRLDDPDLTAAVLVTLDRVAVELARLAADTAGDLEARSRGRAA
jgi:hypothetical protein